MRNNKIILFLATFCLMAGVFTSCQKDSVTLRLRVASFSHDGKVHMEGYTPKWDAGSDLVCVNGETCTVSSNAVEVERSLDYKAVYPAGICVSLDGNGVYQLTIPKIQVYKTISGSNIQVVEAPMGAHSNTSAGSANLYFKNLGALLAITIQNHTGRGDLIVDQIVVSSSCKPLWGSATLAMPQTTSESNGNNPSYVINEADYTHQSVTLAGSTNGGSMGVTVDANTPKQFYVYVPAFTPEPSNKFTIEVRAHNNAGVGVYIKTQGPSGNGNIPLNLIGSMTYELTANNHNRWIDNTRPAGALLQGEFTINQNGAKVYFSAGNLQYRPSDRKWRIAENQWDYVGYYNPAPNSATATHYGTVADGSNRYTSQIIRSNTLSSWTYWIDLFGWGTSGYSGVTNQAMPYDYVTTTGNTNLVYGGTDALDANYDWGRHNTIWYGENSSDPGTWRTLTYEEWQYLLGFTVGTVRGRAVGGTGSNYRGLGKTYSIVQVSVNNVYITGLLIYPDDYQDGDLHPNTHDGTSEINLSEYPSCAFLPCAGIRNGISTDTENNIDYPNIANLPGQPSWTNDNPLGYYWTATPVDGTYAGAYKFPTGNNKIEYNQSEAHRYKGCSVRLVTDVTSTSSSK